MIDMAHNKIDNLSTGHKDITGKDIPKKMSFKIYLELFLEVCKLGIMVIIIMGIKSNASSYLSFTFNMGGHAHNNQNQQRQGGINLMYLLGIFFLLYILPALFSTKS